MKGQAADIFRYKPAHPTCVRAGGKARPATLPDRPQELLAGLQVCESFRGGAHPDHSATSRPGAGHSTHQTFPHGVL